MFTVVHLLAKETQPYLSYFQQFTFAQYLCGKDIKTTVVVRRISTALVGPHSHIPYVCRNTSLKPDFPPPSQFLHFSYG